MDVQGIDFDHHTIDLVIQGMPFFDPLLAIIDHFFDALTVFAFFLH
jgi:hypothetical protein